MCWNLGGWTSIDPSYFYIYIYHHIPYILFLQYIYIDNRFFDLQPSQWVEQPEAVMLNQVWSAPGLDTLCLPENRAIPIPLVNHHCPIILAFWWYTPFPDTPACKSACLHDTKPKIFIESACGNTCAAPTHIKPQPGSFTVEVVKVRVHVITHAIMFTRVCLKMGYIPQ